MKKETLKEKIIEILEEYQPEDPDEYDMNIEGATDKILELLVEEKKKWGEEIENWLREVDITKPASSVVAILYRRLKKLTKVKKNEEKENRD